ncbi:MAG: Holliday junction branch migration protein RuvA [bacterium]|nr:Holliday junction branch migration protein RuvA [Gammaproteobacteria bacterium]
MIGRIHGKLVEKQPTQILIDVGGVCYEIEVPVSTFYELGGLGDLVTIHTQMIVREDAQLLYGFYSLTERELFRSLIKVNKVGPKLAINILSGVDVIQFSRFIRNKDEKSLMALPGVGKSTAEQLIISMKNRLPDLSEASPANADEANENFADAEAALIELGYKPQEAARAVSQTDDPDSSVEKLIKQALRLLS